MNQANPQSIELKDVLELVGSKELVIQQLNKELARLQAEVARLRADLAEATKDKAVTS